MGYACSKWVYERMPEDTNDHYGLPIWIRRPSTIIRQGHDAASQRARFGWVNKFLEYSHKIQAVPQIVNKQGALDLVHVQTCCEDIIADFKSDKPRLASGMTYQHNVAYVVIPMKCPSEIAWVKRHQNPYQILPWEEWTEKAIAAGLHPAVAGLIGGVDEQCIRAYQLMIRASEPL
jgi:thioester reductase-like protein